MRTPITNFMTKLFNLFTRDSYTVLANAKRIAKKYQQSVITPDHLLWGLLTLAPPQVDAALQILRVNPTQLLNRLEATLKLTAKEPPPPIGYQDRSYQLSQAVTEILQAAQTETQEQSLDIVDPRLLLLGMVRQADNSAGELLRSYNITLEILRPHLKLHETPIAQPRFRLPQFNTGFSIFGVSPIFWGLLLFTGLSGYFTYKGFGNPSRTLFLFVLGGWLTSVALHEFGHAIVAFWGGDKSVADKGYLTLDPLKYTHPLLSIVFPVVFLLMGGMPLSGGAVYINDQAIRSRFMRSFVSAAGPIATAMCAFILILPFATGLYASTFHTHMEFWAGVALLAFLEILALLLNLMPIPGLDGFHIMEPFLPHEVIVVIDQMRPFALILLFLILTRSPLGGYLSDTTWDTLFWIDPHLALLAAEGFDLFFFWR